MSVDATPTAAQFPMVSVCVVYAFQRLERLLTALAAQTYPPERLQIVVVNLSDGTSSTITQRASGNFLQLILHEDKGVNAISQARNVAASLATGEWIAYIGTEYIPPPRWLEEMVRTAVETRAAIVLGPKIALFPFGTATWVTRSKFFDKRRFRTGARVSSDFGRTSNSLVAADWLKARPGSPFEIFNEHDDLEGHDFFLWVEKSEGRIIWSDGAEVSTVIPQSHHNLKYMLTRSLKSSSAYWRNINRYRSGTQIWANMLIGVGGACGAAIVGAAMLPFGLHAAAPHWVKMAKGLGRATALGGACLRDHSMKSN